MRYLRQHRSTLVAAGDSILDSAGIFLGNNLIARVADARWQVIDIDKGIGAAIAIAFEKEGARVAVNYSSDRAGADATVETITSAGGTAFAVQAEVGDETAVGRLFADVQERWGAVDIVVNNAGVWRFEPIRAVTVAEFHREYDTNVLGNVLISRAFARQPALEDGVIVNVTSVGIGPASAGTSLYTGTKMAIAGLTRTLAVELAPRRIRVNAIAAGLVDTAGTRATGFMGSQAQQDLVAGLPLGRVGQPEDIAGVAVFLAADESRFMTGQVLFVDGGQSLL